MRIRLPDGGSFPTGPGRCAHRLEAGRRTCRRRRINEGCHRQAAEWRDVAAENDCRGGGDAACATVHASMVFIGEAFPTVQHEPMTLHAENGSSPRLPSLAQLEKEVIDMGSTCCTGPDGRDRRNEPPAVPIRITMAESRRARLRPRQCHASRGRQYRASPSPHLAFDKRRT